MSEQRAPAALLLAGAGVLVRVGALQLGEAHGLLHLDVGSFFSGRVWGWLLLGRIAGEGSGGVGTGGR